MNSRQRKKSHDELLRIFKSLKPEVDQFGAIQALRDLSLRKKWSWKKWSWARDHLIHYAEKGTLQPDYVRFW